MSVRTLIELLQNQAEARPEQLALTFELDDSRQRQWTFGELDRRARAVAAQVQQVAQPGDRAVLLFPPGLDYVAGFFGCLYAGVIAAPACYPKVNRPMPRLTGVLRDAQPKLVLTNDWGLEQFEQGNFAGDELNSLTWMSAERLRDGVEDQWSRPNVAGDDLAFLQYTSGSTSDPRGVMVSHANLLHNLGIIKQGFGLGCEGEGVFWLPAYHDMGLIGGILTPIYVGRPATLMSPASFLQRPMRWLQTIADRGATISGAPNFAYDLCVEKATPEQIEQLDLSTWEVAFCGAEPVRRETLDRFAETFAPCGFRREAFYPCFGLAEATLIASGSLGPAAPKSLLLERAGLERNEVRTTDSEHHATEIISCGQTFDQRAMIVDPETHAPVASGRIGEIWLQGPSVARGYWNHPEESQRVFGARLAGIDEGPFLRTGDLGFLREGELYVTGRLKDLIIVRGRNFYPQDIERTVESAHDSLQRSSTAAFTIDVNGESRLVVVQEVERRRRKSSTEDAIAAIRAAVVREHEIQPHAVVLVKPLSLPKTSSGKIKRHACRHEYLRRRLQSLGQWEQEPGASHAAKLHHERNGHARTNGRPSAKGHAASNGHAANGAAASAQSKSRPSSGRPSVDEIRRWLITHIAEHVGVDPDRVDAHAPLERCGLDSLGAVVLSGDLENWLGVRVQPTLVYDYPTIDAIARYLAGQGQAAADSETHDPPSAALSEPIAIVGMGCRFPGGADDPEAFWSMLREGRSGVSEAPADRWNMAELYDPDPSAPGKMSTRWGGFLKNVDQFDPLFFGISPREASTMDPQQRLFLEVAWEALENAGLAPERLANSATGVFAGVCTHDYSQLFHRLGSLKQIDAYFGTGNAFSVTSGRLSHILGLQGPSLVVDTACSSSLVSVHLACQSLRTGECRAALAGGVTLMLSPTATINFSKAHMMAADGRCKTFDASADGYVRGEGCGVVVLKRLSDAQADGDRILAIIRGSAVNHDGHSNGLTAPNGQAQEAVIRRALAAGGVDARDVGYVEAHGTGTSLGDPIEVRAIGAALGKGRDDAHRLTIGSVKTNIGHLEAAAGVAGLIKAVLVLQHGEIPPHLHFQKINPYIPLDEIPVRVPTERTAWPAGEKKRIAGVSAYAFSGTNAHVVLEEAPMAAAVDEPTDRPLHLLTLSAKSDAALKALAGRTAGFLAAHAELPAGDVAYSANTGRAVHGYRAAVFAASTAEFAERLAALAADEQQQPAGVYRGAADGPRPKVAFLFTGQGSQYAGMGRELYETQPAFRRALDACAAALVRQLDRPLLEVIFAEGGEVAGGARLLDQTAYTQPALFALEYSLAQLWMSWGVEPAAVLGHSVGEYVAACIAGVFSLEDGLRLIAKRAALMQRLPVGSEMAAVFAPLAVVEAAVAPYAAAAVATINGPESIVISGAGEAIRAILAGLERDGVRFQKLNVSHAFHSPLMEPMLDEFEQAAAEIEFSEPRIPLVSNVTGRFVEGAELSRPGYWRRHVREAVRFAAGVEALREAGVTAYVEMGPGSTLLGLAQQTVGRDQAMWLPSLRRSASDWQALLESVAKLYAAGASIDWTAFDAGYARRRVALPTYPFQRDRYWMNFQRDATDDSANAAAAAPKRAAGRGANPLLGAKARSPLKDQLFESELSVGAIPYLVDHQVYRTIVLPAAAYLEMALSAARESLGGASPEAAIVLEQVRLKKPLLLADGAAPAVQTVISPEKATASFQVTSLAPGADGADEWPLHARGRARVVEAKPQAEDVLEELKARCSEPIPAGLYYQRLELQGLQYGPAFQPIRQLARGDGEALGYLQLGDSLSTDGYQIHPALLDGCFQMMGATLPADLGEGVFVPVGLEKLELRRPAGGALWCHARLRKEGDGRVRGMVKGDLMLLDEAGEVLGEVAGLWLAQATPEQLVGKSQPRLADSLYQIEWRATDGVETNSAEPQAAGSWLILADDGGLGDSLAEQLALRGERVVAAKAGDEFQLAGPDRYIVNPGAPEDLARLLAETAGADAAGWRGIVHLWSIGDRAETAAEVDAQVARGCGGLLHALKALPGSALAKAKPRWWIATCGAQSVDGESAAPAQAAVWGLGRVAMLEQPDLRPCLIDLDPQADADDRLEALISELWFGDGENQIAYRGGARYAARLARAAELIAEPTSAAEGPVRLEISRRGVLDNVSLKPMTRRQPAPDEVEIEVMATGLNFRDVLNVLGLYPGDPGPLGGECSGRIAAVGKNVQGLAVGDEVLGIASGSFGTFVTTHAALVAPKPKSMSFAEAATIPIAFLTAHYGLNHLARAKAGDRLLLHAASGGVGLAAIQLATRADVEVFGTAGSDAKRDYLRSLGVRHVMNSRSLDFADEIPRLTDGEGVNIVLNSFSGEFIPKSLSTLAPGGVFLEIGKAEIWDEARVTAERPGVAYHAIALDHMVLKTPELVGAMLRELMPLFESGELKPLEHKVFPLPKAVNAFRFMAQAKHIGKIVVTASHVDESLRDSRSSFGETGLQGSIRGDATYLITGGVGALGLHVARHFALQGARQLVLTSRREPAGAAAAAIDELRTAGVNVRVIAADVAERGDVVRLLDEISDLPPLAGVVHAAGVLEDGMLANQTWERFEKVLAPKVRGAWHLHELTQSLSLDFFVMFSSVASVLGSPGQGNYAAANAFLDGLAHQRRAAGLPALSINWGPWADGGMATVVQSRGARAAGGLAPLPAAQGVRVLASLLGKPPANVAAFQVDWPGWVQAQPKIAKMPLLAELTGDLKAAPRTSQHRDKILAAPAGTRQQLLETYVREQVARIMQIPVDRLDVQLPLSSLGLDSLMAVEMKNLVESDLDVELPAATLIEGPSIAQLAAELLGQLAEGAAESDATESAAAEPAASETSAAVAAPAKLNGKHGAMSASNGASRWIANYQPQPDPALRLFCFHYLGGGASAFRGWQEAMPSQIEVCPVQLPGRENRRGESAYHRMDELVAALTEHLAPYCDRPFAVYGHSMGTIVGFELALRLQAELGRSPVHFFAGGYYAPEMKSRYQTKQHWDEQEIIEKAKTLLEAPEEILANKEFMRALAPTIKADLSLLGGYQYRPGTLLDCPVTALGGQDDHEVFESDVAQWRNYTTGPFDLQMTPGGHLFLLNHQRQLLREVLRRLASHLPTEPIPAPPALIQTPVSV